MTPSPTPTTDPIAAPARSLRRRIDTGIIGVATLAVLLFALPLAVAVDRLDRGQELAELQRDATRTAALVPDNRVGSGPTAVVPGAPGGDILVGVYTPGGNLSSGRGAKRSRIAGAAHDGRVHQGSEQGQLAVAVPVASDRNVAAVVRAAVPDSVVTSRTRRSWAAMAALGLLVLAVAALLARRQSRRIAGPLERLTAAARELGDGNFVIVPERSGIREADDAGAALRDTAARLGQLLDRERAFSADASHQLRTPLTGLLLGLESALGRPEADLRLAVSSALERGRRLEETVETLLSLRRDTGSRRVSIDVEVELSAVIHEWLPLFSARRRPLVLAGPSPVSPASASTTALRQILDVLLDNALHHGAGTVTLSAADLGDAVAIEVADEGEGLRGDAEAAFTRRSDDARGHGIGLALARSLAEAESGRLVVRRAAPHPIFAVLLPIATTVVASAGRSPRD